MHVGRPAVTLLRTDRRIILRRIATEKLRIPTRNKGIGHDPINVHFLNRKGLNGHLQGTDVDLAGDEVDPDCFAWFERQLDRFAHAIPSLA